MDFDRLSETAEVRSVPFTDVDLDKGGRRFRGYAAPYDQVTDLGPHTEAYRRGAFRKAISADGGNIPMLYDHNPGLPAVATTRGKTLRLKEDGKGLLVEADVARHFVGDAIYEMVERGDISGMSIGMVVGRGNSRIETRNGKPHRDIHGLKRILDVSPTWDPAYTGTDAAFRSLRALQMTESLEAAQQLLAGDTPEQREEGASLPEGDGTPQPGEAGDEKEPATEALEAEAAGQRSGVDVQAASAARKRRLMMMGMTLPPEFRSGTPAPVAPEHAEPAEKRGPRAIDELLQWPRETWSGEEVGQIRERRAALHRELYELVDNAERFGRSLDSEEQTEFERLQGEFNKLTIALPSR